MLNDPVFERMEGDHGKESVRSQQSGHEFHRALNVFEFAIDRDAESLKGPSCTIDSAVNATLIPI